MCGPVCVYVCVCEYVFVCMEIVDLIKYAMVPATENMKRRNVWYRTWMTGKLVDQCRNDTYLFCNQKRIW